MSPFKPVVVAPRCLGLALLACAWGCGSSDSARLPGENAENANVPIASSEPPTPGADGSAGDAVTNGSSSSGLLDPSVTTPVTPTDGTTDEGPVVGATPAVVDMSPEGVGSAPDEAATAAGSTLSDVLSREEFDALFLHEDDPACGGAGYSYATLVDAASSFPLFAAEGSSELRRREVAAFLANISHETTGGWPTAPDGPNAWGLCFLQEVGCENGGCTAYCQQDATYPCATGKTYHGRGPIQLTWNYNYGPAGEALGLDLLADPDSVVSSPTTGWRTALWFWMTAQPPKPSAHDVMVGNWQPGPADVDAGRVAGFGLTINIINGGLECGIPGDARVADRVGFFERYTGLLAVDPGPDLTCDAMQSY